VEKRLAGLFREWPIWALILLGAIYFAEPLFFGQTFYYRDLYSHFLPVKKAFVTLVGGGNWPLWNPYIHGGEPFLSNPNNTALYPSNLLYLALPLLTAFNLDIVLHLILGSVFAYLLARAVGLDRLPAFVAAVIYGYCGYTLSLGNLLNRLLAMPYVPLITLLWHQFLLRRQRWYFALAVLAGVCQMLPGAPETVLLTLVFVFGWSLFYPYPVTTVRERVSRFAMLALLIGGLAAAQILPALEMTHESSRASTHPGGDLGAWSLHGKRALETVLPGFSGRTDALAATDYWGAPNEDQGFPLILSIYFGLLAIVLSFCAALSPFGDDTQHVRFRRFLLVFMLGSFVLSFGRFLPGFVSAVSSVPVLSSLRYPIKFMAGAVLPVALLCGIALQSVERSLRPSWASSRKAAWALSTITAALIGLTVMQLAAAGFGEWFQQFFFTTSRPQIAEGLRRSMLHAGGIWAAAVLVLFHRRLRPSAWQPWVLAGIIVIDLLAAGRAVNTYAPRGFFTDEPELAGIIGKEIGNGRLYRVPKSTGVALNAPANDVMYQYRWNLEVLNGYVAPLYGIPIVFHEDLDRMSARRIANLTQLVSAVPWDKRIPLLSAGGASLILTDESLSIGGVTPVAKVSTASNTPFYLYRNEAAASAVTLVHSWRSATKDEDELTAMMSPGFDPKTEVVIRGPAPSAPPSGCGGGADAIQTIADSGSSRTYRVSSPCDGYLVFSEPHYEGWDVFVDGEHRPLVRSNFAFSSVFLPAGEHTVRWRYRPRSLPAGLAITAISALLLIVVSRRLRR